MIVKLSACELLHNQVVATGAGLDLVQTGPAGTIVIREPVSYPLSHGNEFLLCTGISLVPGLSLQLSGRCHHPSFPDKVTAERLKKLPNVGFELSSASPK